MFQDGSNEDHFVKIASMLDQPSTSLNRQDFATSQAGPLATRASVPQAARATLCSLVVQPIRSCSRRTDADPCHRALQHAITPESGADSSEQIARITGLHRFPLNNFKYFLTLFSKFFSSFPHGTCSLSVSRQYLALDGIYHPFRAALPSNPTL